MEKGYLVDLQQKGIPIPNTKIIKKGADVSLKDCFHEVVQNEEVVIKPTVAASGRNTHRIHKNEIADYEQIFAWSIENEDMMVQSFVDSVLTKGEVSMVMIDGTFTHAILKRASKGEFRVQSDFGGTIEHYEPSEKEIRFAQQICQSLDMVPSYARVDLVYDGDEPLLSELELIEPELWFREQRSAAELLVDHLKQKYFE